MKNHLNTPLQIANIFVLMILLVGSLFWTCKRVNTAGPPETTLDSALVTPVSYVGIPIHYELERFAAFLNAKITGNFLKQGMRVRENKDSIYMEISKSGPIGLRIKGQKLYISFPLHAQGTYFGKFAGIKVENKKHPVETDIRLLLEADVSIDENWRIKPDISLTKIEWIKDPVAKVGPVKINLQETLDQLLQEKKPELEKMLETQIHDHVSLEKVVRKIWLDLQKPMSIYKKNPNVWFKFGFHDIAGTIQLHEPDLITCNLLLQAHTAISIDSLRLPPTDSVLPRLKPYPQDKEAGFDLAVHVSIPFQRANATINQMVKGAKVEKQGYAIVIEDVKLYGIDDGIAVQVHTSGDINGNLYLTGRPRYYDLEGVMRLEGFHYDFYTQSRILNTAFEVLRDPLLEYLKPYLEVEVGQYLSMIPGIVSGAIEKGKPGQTIDLHIDSLNVLGHYGIATRSDVQVVLLTHGQAKVELEKLKAGKSIQIGKKKR